MATEKDSIVGEASYLFQTRVLPRLKLILLIFTLLFTISVAYTLLRTPEYQASARLMVETRDNKMMPTESALSGIPSTQADIVDTEVEALHSPALFGNVVDDLQLDTISAFGGSTFERDRAIEKLRQVVQIHRAGETYIIDILARSDQPALAAKIANSIARQHLAMQIETKRVANRKASELLLERIDEMATKVESAEDAVQNYKAENGLAGEHREGIGEQSLAEIENELAFAKAAEGAAFGALRASITADPGLAGAGNPALEQLLVQKAAAEQNWQRATEIYGPAHPRYRDAQTQLHLLEDAVAQERGRARAASNSERKRTLIGLRAEANAAAQKRKSLQKSASQSRVKLVKNDRSQVRLNILQRKADAMRATYEAYLARYQETTTQIGTEQPDSRILSSATVPSEPLSPNILNSLLFGALASLALALGIVLITGRFLGKQTE